MFGVNMWRLLNRRRLLFQPTHARVLALAALFVTTCPAPASHAKSHGSTSLGTRQLVPLPEVSGPHCGISALYACLIAIDVDAELKDLWRPEYISKDEGSSALELIQAARNNGAYASAIEGLAASDLVHEANPMILHVRSKGSANKFNHWIAYLGFDEDCIKVFDIAHGVRSVTKAELMAAWDGYAIRISSHPVPVASFRGWSQSLLLLCTIGNIALLFQFFTGNASGPVSVQQLKLQETCTETSLLILLITAVAIGFHSTSDVGFIRNASAVSLVQASYFPESVFESVSSEYVKEAVESHRAVIIDARYAASFRRGAIPSAVNIPINSSLEFRANQLGNIGRDAKIIVYCQSSKCRFADKMAAFLKLNGFVDVKVFQGGYIEWTSIVNP